MHSFEYILHTISYKFYNYITLFRILLISQRSVELDMPLIVSILYSNVVSQYCINKFQPVDHQGSQFCWGILFAWLNQDSQQISKKMNAYAWNSWLLALQILQSNYFAPKTIWPIWLRHLDLRFLLLISESLMTLQYLIYIFYAII